MGIIDFRREIVKYDKIWALRNQGVPKFRHILRFDAKNPNSQFLLDQSCLSCLVLLCLTLSYFVLLCLTLCCFILSFLLGQFARAIKINSSCYRLIITYTRFPNNDATFTVGGNESDILASEIRRKRLNDSAESSVNAYNCTSSLINTTL